MSSGATGLFGLKASTIQNLNTAISKCIYMLVLYNFDSRNVLLFRFFDVYFR